MNMIDITNTILNPYTKFVLFEDKYIDREDFHIYKFDNNYLITFNKYRYQSEYSRSGYISSIFYEIKFELQQKHIRKEVSLIELNEKLDWFDRSFDESVKLSKES